jgi:outer membrane lipoprotein-sorting protein
MPQNKPGKHFSGFNLIIFFILFPLILCSGCAAIDFKGKQDVKAYNLAEQIRNSNKDIKTSKGIGKITIQETIGGKPMATEFKIAWVAEPPSRIRVTLLSSGFPVETIVSNEKSITLFSHTGKHDLKTYNIKNPSLKDILLIPVKVEDVILLLSGQTPIKDFTHAFFENSSKTIVLKNKLGNGIQKISINSRNRINKYIVANWKAEHLLEVMFLDSIEIDSAIVPSRLTIQDNLDRKVFLEISKFYINQPVKKSVFSLTEPR